jgi:hypothetical protein
MWHVWGTEEVHTGIWRGNVREIDNMEDLRVDGRIILKCIFEKWDWAGIEWIDLAQDRNRWQALVNGVMNFRVP